MAGGYNDAFMRNNDDPSATQARAKAQTRNNLINMKLMGQAHPTGLTNNLLKLFVPRPPLEYKPLPERRKCPPYTGMAQFVSKFASPGEPEYAPPVQEPELPSQRRSRIRQLRLENGTEKATKELLKYDPNNDPNVSGDPYKTLFIARLNYETSESRVKREFEAYGPIKRVRLITEKESNKSRGYGFVEFLHTRDMKSAYKQADGRKLDNKRLLVDVERGRTVPNWRPRRLGGGLGTSRVGGEEVNHKSTGREQQPSGTLQSEEFRTREDRHQHQDREKSRERGRERERVREKSSEQSQDRPRRREHKEDRHRRDHDRNRDKERVKEQGQDRDRTHDRRRDRDQRHDRSRDRELDPNGNRSREGDRTGDRDHEAEDDGDYLGYPRDRESDHLESKHLPDKRGGRNQDYDPSEPEDDAVWNEQLGQRGKHPERDHDNKGRYGRSDHLESKHLPDKRGGRNQDYDPSEPEDDAVWNEQLGQRGKHPERDHDNKGRYGRYKDDSHYEHDRYQYDQMDEDNYNSGLPD